MTSAYALKAPRPARKETGSVAPDNTVACTSVQRPTPAWPLTSYREFPAVPAATGEARRHARAIAMEFGLSALADTIELIVSETATNAVCASAQLCTSGLTAPVFRLWLASDLHTMLIRVWDASNEMPAWKDASPDDESGRGLVLVDFLASEWGAYREQNGKVVWVLVG